MNLYQKIGRFRSVYNTSVAFLLLLAAGLLPSHTSKGQFRPGMEDWEDHFGFTGVYGTVHAMAADNEGNIYLGGSFNLVNDGSGFRPVLNIVRWDGETFHDLGAGVQGTVYALDLDQDGNLYAGGFFSYALQTPEELVYAHNIAKWDGFRWSALGHSDFFMNGTDNTVNDILVMGDTVYVAGHFSSVRRLDGSTLQAPHLAGWHNDDWFDLQGGTDRPVNTLAALEGALYAGGTFEQAGGITARSVAIWDGGQWSALAADPGPHVVVNAIAFGPDGDLYAGGSFMMIGGIHSNNAARFDGEQWHAMDQGIGMLGATVHSIAADDLFVYFGGYLFDRIGDVEANQIVRWDGSTWHGMKKGIHGTVYDMAFSGDNLYVAGDFGVAGHVSAGSFARWDGFDWHPPAGGPQMGMGADVRAIGATEHGIYAGGSFLHAGPGRISYIARWDGASWQELGKGVSGWVETITVHDDRIYAGGSFTHTGELTVNHLAMWDGRNWHPIGRGVNGTVRAIAVDREGRVYAGGTFTSATNTDGSTVPVHNIAMWDGSAWHPLSGGMDGWVYALIAEGDQVYAGGSFMQAGERTVNHLGRWDGSSWHDVGGGTDATVYALASNGVGTLYAGGAFSAAGNKPATNIAAWDGRQWHDMHGGLEGPIYAMTWQQGTLYAAGYLPHGKIARWRHGRWSTLPGGLLHGEENGMVNTLAVLDKNIYAGGVFLSAAGIPSSHIASWTDRSRERFEMLMFTQAPGIAMAVETGSTHHLQWSHAPAVQDIRLEILFGDEFEEWQILADSFPAHQGTYELSFDETRHDSVSLLISDRYHPDIYDVSGPFSVYPRKEIEKMLRIPNDDGTYHIFHRPYHAWSFSNKSENIWPHDHRFPDWDLYCRAMGSSHCYSLFGIPRRRALALWAILKSIGWNGSCSGFTTTSLMFFNDFYRVSHSFPGEQFLYDVPVNSSAREMINIQQIRFIAPVATNVVLHRLDIWNDSPSSTLSKIENSLGRKRNHVGLVIMEPGWGISQLKRMHTVLPVKVERNTDRTAATVYLYENQDPSELHELQVDLLYNTWTYRRFGVTGADRGMFVSPPLSVFMEMEEERAKPLLREEMLPDEPDGDNREDPPSHITVYSTPGSGILLENTLGEQIGMRYDGSFVHTLGQSMPLLSMHPSVLFDQPLGYVIPTDNYRITRHHLDRSASQLSIVAGDQIYICRNTSPEANDRDIIHFREGVSVINPDVAGKQIELEIITRELDLERQYLIQGMNLSPDDSIHVSVDENLSIQILNIGSEKQYDLMVAELPENDPLMQMKLPGLTIVPNARYRLMTGRDLFFSDSVRVYIDTNLDGFFNDSLRVFGLIVTTDARPEQGHQLPSEYRLDQNYPNPFNAATTIAFELPEPGMVRLELYNLLGQRVAVIGEGLFEAGRHQVVLDASQLPSGVYLYRLQAGSFVQTRKLMLVK